MFQPPSCMCVFYRGVHVAVRDSAGGDWRSPLLHGAGGRPVHPAGQHRCVEAHLPQAGGHWILQLLGESFKSVGAFLHSKPRPRYSILAYLGFPSSQVKFICVTHFMWYSQTQCAFRPSSTGGSIVGILERGSIGSLSAAVNTQGFENAGVTI